MRRPPDRADSVSAVLARNRLGVILVTFFVFASMGPLLVTAGLAPSRLQLQRCTASAPQPCPEHNAAQGIVVIEAQKALMA